MSAAAQRATVAAAGRDLLAASGSAGERRAMALTGCGEGSRPVAFAMLVDAPAWLRWPRERQRQLAEIVALRTIAPAVASSIDGVWLRSLAERVGDDAVDWAIAASAAAETGDADAIAPERLAARGFAVLRAALPSPMRGYLSWAPPAVAAADPPALAAALAFVAERGA